MGYYYFIIIIILLAMINQTMSCFQLNYKYTFIRKIASVLMILWLNSK